MRIPFSAENQRAIHVPTITEDLNVRELTTNPGTLSPFHVAFPVHDLALARAFYGRTLGCPEGRSSSNWVDFNFYGHQIVAHLVPAETLHAWHNTVDEHDVPVPHFGLVLPMAEWEALATRLRAKDVRFLIEPHTRFKGQHGEQATMFLLDPSGNAIEIKSFSDITRLFAQ